MIPQLGCSWPSGRCPVPGVGAAMLETLQLLGERRFRTGLVTGWAPAGASWQRRPAAPRWAILSRPHKEQRGYVGR